MRQVLGKSWASFRVPMCCLGVLLLFGCEGTMETPQVMAKPPAGTTGITVGSSGYASLKAGTTSGEVGIFIVDQDNNPFADASYLNSANVSVEVRRMSSVRSNARSATLQPATLQPAQTGTSASDIRVTYRGGSAGQSISYALTLDRSGSMSSSDISNMEQAALSFVRSTRTGDEGAVINFGSSVVVDQGLTNDSGRLATAIQNPGSTGQATALFDSIGSAVTVLDRAVNPIRAVICMTDGGENSSSYFRTEESVISHANAKRIPVHCIGIGGANERVLRSITGQTNGLYSSSSSTADLADLYQKISKTLSSSFGIAFTSPVAFVRGDTYEVKVTVTYENGITDSITVTSEA